MTLLEQSDNPFAPVVMAHSYTKDTKHKPNERFELKWRLTRMWYERGARCAIMGYNIRVGLRIKRTSSIERRQMGRQRRNEQSNLGGAIVGGVTGAAVGGMLGVALGDLPLEGSIIGGLLGVIAGGLRSKGEQKKNGFPTGKQVDMYFNAHPQLSRYIEDKLKRGLKVEGNLHFLSNDEFVEECIEYITEHLNYKTKARYTEEEATELALGTSAYLSMRKIYVNQDRAHAGTVIHEAVHLFQYARYAKELGFNINEGTTEYFTRLLCDSHQLTRHPKYRLQYECIEQLVNVCGQEKLAEAYFQGHISVLERAVDATKGQRTFHKWKVFMNNEKFEEAKELL